MHNKRPQTHLLIAFLGLLLVTSGLVALEEPLQPDQAFRISGQPTDSGDVLVSWDIAEGYYLYRSKFKFRSETPGVELGRADFPPAKTKQDEFFGEVEIYRSQVSVRLPVKRDPGTPDILTLETRSQGCADFGLCYPPHKQTILLELPPPSPGETLAGSPVPTVASRQPALDALAELNGQLGLGLDDDILPADEAYQFRAEVEGPELLHLTWDIADGTYLYKEKIKVSLQETDQVRLGRVSLPQGEIKPDSVKPDGTVGDVDVYHRRLDLPVPLVRATTEPTEVTLVVRYQGCAERGICYPPVTQKVALQLPAADIISVLEPGVVPDALLVDQGAPISEQDRIAATLKEGNTWLTMGTFFGFGLLLALTPCVFPMIPILSGIIAGHGRSITPRKAFVLSLVYVLAMALTYTVAGVLAGLFGANIQAAFQNPWILSGFALVFVALAFSMFGFYDLQLPSSLQSKLTELSNRQQGGTLVGVAIMGFLSALIVGPCVAPPLAGALIYIGQTGDGVLGGLALFALSMGMGAPLIVIGTSAGKLLPKAGPWMDAVKAVFGVLLLAVAIVLLERILPPAVAMLLWGFLLICSGVYLDALQPLPTEVSGWHKLWKGLGVALLIYGALMLVGAAAGGRDTVQPLRGLGFSGGGAEQAHLTFRRIKTVEDLERELGVAASTNAPVMLDFYADWCVSCKEMERYTFANPEVIRRLEPFVLLQADVTANDDRDKALMQERFGMVGPPAILFFGPDGKERRSYRVVGFMPAAEFAQHVTKAVQ